MRGIILAILVTAIGLINVNSAIAGNLPEFTTQVAAQQHCPSDVVVWLNTNSGIYHYQGTRWYGTTKHGAYVCEKEAVAEGMRASKK